MRDAGEFEGDGWRAWVVRIFRVIRNAELFEDKYTQIFTDYMEINMIEKDKYENLLNNFDLGASTAENDPLLEAAKIETQEFYDLYWKDRIDIIKGIKGSGKTALYRLLFFIKDYSIEKKNLFCIFGIEASGDPVFRLFYQEFENYTEIEFENFWNIYFILLINNLIEEDSSLKDKLKLDKDIIKKIINSMGIKITKNQYSLKDSISGIQILFNSKLKFGVKTDIDENLLPKSVTPLIEIEPHILETIKIKPIYITEFKEKITKILSKHDIKIWIMLDRLDEVFPHRSHIEKSGLKSQSDYHFIISYFIKHAY